MNPKISLIVKSYIILIFSLLICIQSTGQESSNLCVGSYWTENEGAEFLDSVKYSIKSLNDWNSRAKLIHEVIILGAELSDRGKDRAIPLVKNGQVIENGNYQVQPFSIQINDTAWVFGNLYKPVKVRRKAPLVLCPHGHWSNPSDYGRFRDDMQLRCAVLAQMGAWVFAYDMLGYGETKYASHSHPKALKMQTMTGIRILDYFTSLKGIDKRRVAITGASGGGTQTFLLTAIDQRIKVSVPAVQISAHFFGGCNCESGMPIHAWKGFQTNNVEIAALAAPRPMLIISDGDDWTSNTPNVEYPFIKWVYSWYGKVGLVENKHFANEVHDYGYSKRQAMYAFMIKHLKLSDKHIERNELGEISEKSVQLLPYERLKF